jgi:hypothetical protein
MPPRPIKMGACFAINPMRSRTITREAIAACWRLLSNPKMFRQLDLRDSNIVPFSPAPVTG